MRTNPGATVTCALLAMTLLLPWAGQSQTNEAKKTVTLRGTLANFPEKVEIEDFSEMQRIAPSDPGRIIQSKPDSSFSITFPLASPGYFRVGRNVLYLTPGDALTAHINHNEQTASRFEGTGAAANNYLRGTLFPKGGSFLMAGRNIKATPKETIDLIQRLAEERKAELQALQGVTPEFRDLEQARIRADILMSLFKIRTYASAALHREPKESQAAYLEESTKLAKPIQDSLLKGFVNPACLQVEVYRDIYKELDLENATNSAQEIQTMRDWKSALGMAEQIKRVSDKSQLKEFMPRINGIATGKYRAGLQALYDQKMKFGIGDPAADFTATDENGNTVNLSSLKGKVIYVDIWATWCGPCMGEMPALEALKKRYEGNDSVAIVSLSIDDKPEAWRKDLAARKPGGRQWRTDRIRLAEYKIEAIPRCLLIDKDFKVADLSAPLPSSPETARKLDALLGQPNHP